MSVPPLEEWPVTLAIVVATVLISLRAFKDRELLLRWVHYPYQVVHRKEWYRMLSHGFIHSNETHLFFNMLVLFMFGIGAEPAFVELFGLGLGNALFASMYVGALLFACVPSLVKHKNNHYYTSLGASGAVDAVIFACIILFPGIQMGLLFLPIMMPGFIFGPIILAVEYAMAKSGRTGIAHDAHIAGALFGLLFVALVSPRSYLYFWEYVQAYFNLL